MDDVISITPGLQGEPTGMTRPQLSDAQKQSLLKAAARVVVATTLADEVMPGVVGLDEFNDVNVLGAFVTLKRNHRLRSCCGAMSPSIDLGQAVFHAAVRSAIDDPRFPPLSACELLYLDLDVWVLHSQERVAALGEARREAVIVGKHGLQIVAGDRRGLLLPGVAMQHQLDAEGFLRQVCLKAGLPPTAWKDDASELSTFEGDMVEGALGDYVEGLAGRLDDLGATPPLSSSDLTALAGFCRDNIWAVLSGATPSYYAFGVSDANVNGIAVVLEDDTDGVWVQSLQIALRQRLPLQSTLFAHAEQMGRTLAAQGVSIGRLTDARIKFAVLFEPAMQGTVASPDLRGIDMARRSILVTEGAKSVLVWHPNAPADDSLAEAMQRAQVVLPETAAIYSLVTLSNVDRLTVSNVPRPQPGPSLRPAAVAGSFYPADAAELSHLVDDALAGPAVDREVWPAVMVPHAGLKYSGRLAADTLRRVVLPDTIIVIGPKHTRHGVDWAVAPQEAWSIPGATIPADPELARELAAAIPGLQLDADAHQQEHAIEVELPFIFRLAPHARVTGIAIGSGNLERCREFAEALANYLKSRQQSTLLVISSDMNHFATDAENRRLDEMALAAMETLDPAALYETVSRHHISMCGVLPAVIVMETLRRLNGLNRSRRVGYATSGDVTGDRDRVVGYAGMLLG
jgi:AmmeMemoRadiSam system protein B/AmmeMemoRadiSam system protein A